MLTPEQVPVAVAADFGIAPARLTGPKRDIRAAPARAMAILAVKRLFPRADAVTIADLLACGPEVVALVFRFERAWLARGGFAARLERLVAGLRVAHPDPPARREPALPRPKDVFCRDTMPRPAGDLAPLYGGRVYEDMRLRG